MLDLISVGIPCTRIMCAATGDLLTAIILCLEGHNTVFCQNPAAATIAAGCGYPNLLPGDRTAVVLAGMCIPAGLGGQILNGGSDTGKSICGDGWRMTLECQGFQCCAAGECLAADLVYTVVCHAVSGRCREGCDACVSSKGIVCNSACMLV